jgi:hypothetical protein
MTLEENIQADLKEVKAQLDKLTEMVQSIFDILPIGEWLKKEK